MKINHVFKNDYNRDLTKHGMKAIMHFWKHMQYRRLFSQSVEALKAQGFTWELIPILSPMEFLQYRGAHNFLFAAWNSYDTRRFIEALNTYQGVIIALMNNEDLAGGIDHV